MGEGPQEIVPDHAVEANFSNFCFVAAGLLPLTLICTYTPQFSTESKGY